MRWDNDRIPRIDRIWQSGQFYGDQRPTVRATIRRGNVRLTPSKLYGDLASIIFGYTKGLHGTDTTFNPKELNNIRSISWSRDADQDVSECTISLYNSFYDADTGIYQQGAYTWNIGDSPHARKQKVTETPSMGADGFTTGKLRTTGWVTQSFTSDKAFTVSKVRVYAQTAGSYRITLGQVQASRLRGSPPAPANSVSVNAVLGVGATTVTLPRNFVFSAPSSFGPGYYLTIQPLATVTNPSASVPWDAWVSKNDSATTEGGISVRGPMFSGFGARGLTMQQTEGMKLVFDLIGPTTTKVVGERNEMYGWLVPDNIVQTYEGYGANYSVGPEFDKNLVLSGTWLIDDVTNTGDTITLKMRDFGRILMEQVLFPPITPRKSPIKGIAYPIYFESYRPVPNAPTKQTTRVPLRYSGSSNQPYVGVNGGVLGHFGAHAFDGKAGSYWLSIGNNSPNAAYSFEWVQADCGKSSLTEVRVTPRGAYMRGWVSVYANGAWRGNINIPYDPHNPISAPNFSNIKAVAAFNTGADGAEVRVKFPKIDGVTKVRVTFTNLFNSGVGPWVYRAGVREMSAFAEVMKSTGTHIEGNYGDFTDIVKLLLCWGGFHWPKGMPFFPLTDGSAFPILRRNPVDDPYIKEGGVWGDLERTGNSGDVPFLEDVWNQKSLMDGIAVIKNMVGFLFFVDEAGGAIWRHPNYEKLGNWVNGPGVPTYQQRFLRVREDQTLLGITSTLTGRQTLERFYVANPDGKISGSARGYNLNPIGLRRIYGFVDGHWDNDADCKMNAELTARNSMLMYRTAEFEMPGHPALQIDDQIELVDSATGEGYYHYVRSINSELSMEDGTWTYSVQSNWLGTRPGRDWIMDKYGELSADTETLLDFTDRGRRDGVYDGFEAMTF